MASESGIVLSFVKALRASKVSSTVRRCVRGLLASLNSSWASSSGVSCESDRSSFSIPSASACISSCSFVDTYPDIGELPSSLPNSKRSGLASMSLSADSLSWYIAKAVFSAWRLGSC